MLQWMSLRKPWYRRLTRSRFGSALHVLLGRPIIRGVTFHTIENLGAYPADCLNVDNHFVRILPRRTYGNQAPK